MPTSTGTRALFRFFSAYTTFTYNPNASATSEFYRMCDHFKWDKKNAARQDAHKWFRIALTKVFNGKYGTNVENLASWQSLCSRLGVDPIPSEIKQCRGIVTSTHVNLVDLVDNGTVRIFDSVEELSEYSKQEGKIFPREDAHAGELLRYLLRQIVDPSKDSRRGPGRRGQNSRGRGGRGPGRGGREAGRGGREAGRGRGGRGAGRGRVVITRP